MSPEKLDGLIKGMLSATSENFKPMHEFNDASLQIAIDYLALIDAVKGLEHGMRELAKKYRNGIVSDPEIVADYCANELSALLPPLEK